MPLGNWGRLLDSGGASSKIVRSSSGSVKPNTAVIPDPEVIAKPKRRKYTAGYQLDILKQADACTKPGQFGALLRREGLYHSNLRPPDLGRSAFFAMIVAERRPCWVKRICKRETVLDT